MSHTADSDRPQLVSAALFDGDSSDDAGKINDEISLSEVGSIPTRVLNFARLYGV